MFILIQAKIMKTEMIEMTEEAGVTEMIVTRTKMTWRLKSVKF